MGGRLTLDDEDLDRVMELERELQTDACRRNPGRMRALLADDFEEIGASGRVWNRESTLEHLRSHEVDGPNIDVLDMTARMIGENLIMVRWDSDRAERRARRTSLWVRHPAGWRLVHHQATLLPSQDALGGRLTPDRAPGDRAADPAPR